MTQNVYRQLPSVRELLAEPLVAELTGQHGQSQVVEVIRTVLAEVRRELREGATLDRASLPHRIATRVQRKVRPKLCRVINATGIVLHTNLGRAPMATVAAEAARQAAEGYLNLEMDLESGKRSSRPQAVRDWLCRLTGAESATVVNNNAAATVIVLRAVAQGKEVILSRGQLVEIGGSFRIPEIMAVSGAILREVGATNITRRRDYEQAIGPETAALLRVHCSNFRQIGHTAEVPLDELVALGQQYQLPVIDDIGSGALVDLSPYGFGEEPVAGRSIAAGAELVLFSGDKLLGGPQAGIIVGKQRWIDCIEQDPLMRAFRVDKMTLAALEATLRLYLHSETASREIPVLRIMSESPEQVRQRAEWLAEQLRGCTGLASLQVRSDEISVGGGSLPGRSLPTWVVEVRPAKQTEEQFAQCLRTGTTPVIARLQDGAVLFDPRTVGTSLLDELVKMIRSALVAE